MWIRNFDLDDFGCFHRARLQDLEDGLTVIGGPQRAGKTTFMRAMRKLGYGISKGDDLPPPRNKYGLAADVVHEREECSISLSGNATPTLTSEGGSLDLEDVLGGVRDHVYHQLFTISLDQLRQTPPAISDRRELSVILLGAGYGDIAQIPEIKSDLSGQANNIGGMYGREVSQLGDKVDIIREGKENRAEARKHVDQHRAKEADLAELDDEITELEANQARLARQKARLTAIEAAYDEFETYRDLGQTLTDDDRARVDRFPLDALAEAERLETSYEMDRSAVDEAAAALQGATDATNTDDQRAALLDAGAKIERFDRKISGWRQRCGDLAERESELQGDQRDLAERAGALNEAWSESPEDALEVGLDSLTADSVQEITSKFETADQEMSTATAERDAERERLEQTEQALDEASEDEGDATRVRGEIGRVAGLSAAGLVIGGLIGVGVAPLGGLAVTGLFVGIAILYAYVRLLRGELSVGESPIAELRMDKHRLEREIASLDSTIDRAREDRESAEADLEALREELALPSEISAEGLESYYRELDALQGDLREARTEAETIAEKREKLRGELAAVYDTVDPLVDAGAEETALLETAEELFEAVQTASDELELAKDLDAAQTTVRDREMEIFGIISDWPEIEDVSTIEELDRSLDALLEEFIEAGEETRDLSDDLETHADLGPKMRSKFGRRAVREALAPLCRSLAETAEDVAADPEEIDDERILEAAGYAADGHVDVDAINEELDTIDGQLDREADDLDELKEQRTGLESELEDLASDEDINAAQETIERGKQELRPLAERYAENRIAEALVDRLHERFIQQATGPLLEDASELFGRITDEYSDVDQVGSLDDLDFEVLREDGTTQGSTELSRATAEQLFLAVRIARIQQLDVSLPVVYDDSMTNFDPAHLGRTLDLLGELAETNQVFFLTCHPEFVDRTAERTDVGQFWSLEDGRFDGPYEEPDPVMAALRRE